MYTATEVTKRISDWKKGGLAKPDIVEGVAHDCLGWCYVYAAAGCMCSPENRRHYLDICRNKGLTKYADMIVRDCPIMQGTKGYSCDMCKWHDTRVFDCRGFTQWVLAQADISLFGGGATTQYDTKSNWVVRGTIDKMPKDLICCLFKQDGAKMSHTGLWLTNDLIIHCSGTVKEDRLPGNPLWTHFGLPVGLYSTEYLKEHGIDVDESKNVPTLRRGSTGANVRLLQNLLNAAGAKLNVDGLFGKDTEAAVKAFQASNGLTVDGIVGPKTWAKLHQYDHLVHEESDDVDISRSREAWDQLYAGLQNPYAVAAILGNLEAESGINPKNLEGRGNTRLGMTDDEYTEAVDSGAITMDQFATDGFGYGIAQWTYRTRKADLLEYAHSLAYSIGSLSMQVSFLLKELSEYYGSLKKELLDAASVEEANRLFMLKYEKPANISEENIASRAALGHQFFNMYAEPEKDQPADEEPEVKNYYMIPAEDVKKILDAANYIVNMLKAYQ